MRRTVCLRRCGALELDQLNFEKVHPLRSWIRLGHIPGYINELGSDGLSIPAERCSPISCFNSVSQPFPPKQISHNILTCAPPYSLHSAVNSQVSIWCFHLQGLLCMLTRLTAPRHNEDFFASGDRSHSRHQQLRFCYTFIQSGVKPRA